MKRKNATRSALFTSIISLLLCVSMLVGTTFAWFTDSVESGRNVIAAGNLDVELYHSDDKETDVKVDGNTMLFDDVKPDLWEPGALAYENLQVKNVGTLALKYQLSLTVLDETVVNGYKLSDVIMVGTKAGGFTADSREGIIREATDWTKLSAFKLDNSTKSLAAGAAAEKIGIVLYWQPNSNDIDNRYNLNNGQTGTLQLNIGVNLYATQVEAESDSFGPDYDEDAWDNALLVTTADDLKDAIAAGNEEIMLANDIALTEALEIPAGTTLALNLNGKSLTGTGLDADGKGTAVIVNEGDLKLVNGNVKATGENGGATINNKGTLTLADGANIVGAPIAKESGYPAYCINSSGNLTIENGTTVSADRGCLFLSGTGETVINGGTFTNNDIYEKIGGRNFTSHVVVVGSGANNKLTINGGTFKHLHTKTSGGVVINNWSAVTVDVNGGNFSGGNYFGKWDNLSDYGYGSTSTPFSVTGGTFTGMDNKFVAAGYKAVKNSSGYMVISDNMDYVDDGVLKSKDESTFFLSSKEGFKWMADKGDDFFAGKTITLDASIDFGGETIDAVRFWNSENKTTFDGNGKTISNFVLENTDGNAGLFNGTMTVKNLNIVGAEVTGKYAGVIAGNMYGDIINCTVKDSVINGTYWQTGALVGQYNAGNIIDCVVENCEINGLAAVGGLVGILNESTGERKIENCTVKDCEINQTGSFGGNYDKMFGVVTGCVNIKNSTVTITGVYKNNTVKGVASDVLCGVVDDSTNVYVLTTTEDGLVLNNDTALYLVPAEYAENTVVVPEGVTTIGNYAFAYNSNVKTVILPTSVTDLGRGFDSSSVEKVVLNEGLEVISSRAFRNTTALKEVVIPSSVKEIADNAFQKSSIKEIVIPAKVETIGEAAFASSKIEKVTFKGNTSIQGFAFRGCPNLREVHLEGDNVTFIASTLNGRNSMWFCNGESNNPNTSNITFYVANETVAARVKVAMGAEAGNTPVYVDGVPYTG